MMRGQSWIAAVHELLALDSGMLSALGIYGAAACGLAPFEAMGNGMGSDSGKNETPTGEPGRNRGPLCSPPAVSSKKGKTPPSRY